MSKEALNKAISIAGGQSKLARVLNIQRSNISHWKRNRQVPAKHAMEIERLFGIDAHDFNITRVAVDPGDN